MTEPKISAWSLWNSSRLLYKVLISKKRLLGQMIYTTMKEEESCTKSCMPFWLRDLQRRQEKHLNYMARKATSSNASATTTATSSSTATASKVDIRSFLKVKGTRDKNDGGDDSGKSASKKRRLNLKDPSDKNIDNECIEVGGENANEETNSYGIAKVSGEKRASSMRVEEEVKDDQKSREDMIEASDDNAASSIMVEKEVKDDRKSTEERIEASGDKAASSIMVEEGVKDDRKSSEEKMEVSGDNVRLKSYRDRAFSVAAPKHWNDIPLHIKLRR